MTKKPSRRTVELAIALAAGYENDKKTFTRLVIERRSTSFDRLMHAWRAGESKRTLEQ